MNATTARSVGCEISIEAMMFLDTTCVSTIYT
jgi:hypothetical protein